MNPVPVYFHGMTPKGGVPPAAHRIRVLKRATGLKKLSKPFKGQNPEALLKGLLRGLKPDREERTEPRYVLFLHLTPMVEYTGKLTEVLEQSSDATHRLFLILVSGVGVSADHEEYIRAAAMAKAKGFGGLANWRHHFSEDGEKQLTNLWQRIVSAFAQGAPTFENFRDLVDLPEDAAATARALESIYGLPATHSAYGEYTYAQFKQWGLNATKTKQLSDAEKGALVTFVERAAILERQRSQLRHDSICNRLLQSLYRLANIYPVSGEGSTLCEDPDGVADLGRLTKWIFNDLRALIAGYHKLAADYDKDVSTILEKTASWTKRSGDALKRAGIAAPTLGPLEQCVAALDRSSARVIEEALGSNAAACAKTLELATKHCEELKRILALRK